MCSGEKYTMANKENMYQIPTFRQRTLLNALVINLENSMLEEWRGANSLDYNIMCPALKECAKISVSTDSELLYPVWLTRVERHGVKSWRR